MKCSKGKIYILISHSTLFGNIYIFTTLYVIPAINMKYFEEIQLLCIFMITKTSNVGYKKIFQASFYKS